MDWHFFRDKGCYCSCKFSTQCPPHCQKAEKHTEFSKKGSLKASPRSGWPEVSITRLFPAALQFSEQNWQKPSFAEIVEKSNGLSSHSEEAIVRLWVGFSETCKETPLEWCIRTSLIAGNFAHTYWELSAGGYFVRLIPLSAVLGNRGGIESIAHLCHGYNDR